MKFLGEEIAPLEESSIEAAIDTLPNLTSFGSAGATTEILAGDLHMFNPVNGGNPIIRLGSSGSDNLLIQAVYNSGVQTLDEINFITVTSSGTANDGRFNWYVDGVLKATLNDNTFLCYANVNVQDAGATLTAWDSTASSATQGGALKLVSDDGAVMADNHRLGVIEFKGAEDTSSTQSIGARIQAIARDAWDDSNNDADLEFYTTDGTTESKVLTLDADKLATFAGGVKVAGALRPSSQLQYTHHNFKVDLDTTKYYVGLTDADSESTDTTQNDLPMVAPLAGKLLKVFLRTNNDLSGKTITWRLETQATGVDKDTGPTIVGTQSGAASTASSMVTIDFTTGLDSGDNIIDAGDLAFISLQSAQSTTLSKFFITCLWEWDFSSIG